MTYPKDLIHSFNSDSHCEGNFSGLTKREYYAGLAMQGLLSNDGRGFTPNNLAGRSVKMADALIVALNKKE